MKDIMLRLCDEHIFTSFHHVDRHPQWESDVLYDLLMLIMSR